MAFRYARLIKKLRWMVDSASVKRVAPSRYIRKLLACRSTSSSKKEENHTLTLPLVLNKGRTTEQLRHKAKAMNRYVIQGHLHLAKMNSYQGTEVQGRDRHLVKE
ncbi:conserved hypothetical protein [Ricinus communis]|uniref:Uncharacterized protein n=1 Tax=Ricinus communis TaxID=3988 RepID=B9S4J4_RICCO|nr:conserved hypothetical protein [Ricinus communis]